MKSDRPEETKAEEYTRLDNDLAQPDPADVENDDTDLPRRDRITAIIDEVEAERPRVPSEAVYGDTSLNPNRADQLDAHRGEAD